MPAEPKRRKGASRRADIPADVLGPHHEAALLFKRLATLRTDTALFDDVDQLRWKGPTEFFAPYAEKLGDLRLLQRCAAVKQP